MTVGCRKPALTIAACGVSFLASTSACSSGASFRNRRSAFAFVLPSERPKLGTLLPVSLSPLGRPTGCWVAVSSASSCWYLRALS